MNKKYIDDINSIYASRYPLFDKWYDTFLDFASENALCKQLHIAGILQKLRGMIKKENYRATVLKRYYAYLVLKPFEYLSKNPKL